MQTVNEAEYVNHKGYRIRVYRSGVYWVAAVGSDSTHADTDKGAAVAKAKEWIDGQG